MTIKYCVPVPELVSDNVFKDTPNFEPTVKGYVEKGSIGTQTFKKGKVVYIDIPTVLVEDYIEYVAEK